ncbi:hypothetical protein ACSBR2_026199 [Camellia fascicularis]
MASSDLKPVLSSFKTRLGRPWMEYSRTVYLQIYLDTLVDPAGWLEWDGNFALKLCIMENIKTPTLVLRLVEE